MKYRTISDKENNRFNVNRYETIDEEENIRLNVN